MPCPDSPINSPILPVRKASGEWRFVQDLRLVNAAVQPRSPIVPNPSIILSEIPNNATYFSVVDLANAFFSIPVHPESRFWFSFQFQNKRWTWTVMPQGYTESPTVFTEELSRNLESFIPPKGSTLIQYVDDLLICSPDKASCEADTRALLNFLAENGHKVSKNKLQLVKQEVRYLGHLISANGRALGLDRIEAIRKIPKPVTKLQMMTFLGMTGYCRPWIQDYAEISNPLLMAAHEVKKMTDLITWTGERQIAFEKLKLSLTTAPSLGLADYTKVFELFVSEKKGFMSAVLTQSHGDRRRPIAYYSKRLDTVTRGMPQCLRSVAATVEAVLACSDLVAFHQLTVYVPHAVHALLLQSKTAHLTAARSLHWQNVLLTMSNVTLKRCTMLNPSTLLPTEEDGEPHDCTQVVEIMTKPRLDLQDTPLSNPELIYYVDGSCLRNPYTGLLSTAYVICTKFEIVETQCLPQHHSAQAAELVALSRACELAKGRSVTIYTDSRYAFGVCHDHGAVWKNRGFLTANGKPVAHSKLIDKLLENLLLPKEIAICKCAAHMKSSDEISKGNNFADSIAKNTALTGCVPIEFIGFTSLATDSTQLPPSLSEVQKLGTDRELKIWSERG